MTSSRLVLSGVRLLLSSPVLLVVMYIRVGCVISSLDSFTVMYRGDPSINEMVGAGRERVVFPVTCVTAAPSFNVGPFAKQCCGIVDSSDHFVDSYPLLLLVHLWVHLHVDNKRGANHF